MSTFGDIAQIAGAGISAAGGAALALKRYINGGIKRVEIGNDRMEVKLDQHIVQTADNLKEITESVGEVRERTAGIEGMLGLRTNDRRQRPRHEP